MREHAHTRAQRMHTAPALTVSALTRGWIFSQNLKTYESEVAGPKGERSAKEKRAARLKKKNSGVSVPMD